MPTGKKNEKKNYTYTCYPKTKNNYRVHFNQADVLLN